MVEEAALEPVGSGLAPAGDGWFVVNARDAAWLTSESFGARCVFERNEPVVRGLAGLELHKFGDLGLALTVLEPGQPSGLYHAESTQEDFLVVFGECRLLIEDAERALAAWDLVHCPPGTAHAFVGAGAGPCAILMVGARKPDRSIEYPSSDLARRHGAGVETATTSAREAYAPYGHWQRGRPDSWSALPWS
jgi:uncharacterized cupin superfamily protein